MATPPEDKPQRKRLLNVIYFVDASRTRSFRMPLSRLNFLLFTLTLLILWSGASVGLLIREQTARHEAEQRLRDAMATLFEYESLYDGAYEVAYPRDSFGRRTAAVARAKQAGDAEGLAAATRNAPESSAPAPATSPAPKKPVPNPAPKVVKAPPKPASKPAATAAPSPAAPASKAASAPSRRGFSISVESPVVNAEDNYMTVSFRIDNDNRPVRTDGYVWVVAEFVDDQGQRRFIAAPDELNVNNSGEVDAPQRSHRFSIANFKNKKFQINFPRDLAGKFTKIRIGLMSADAEMKRNFFNLPVNIRVGPQNVQGGDVPGGPKSGSVSPAVPPHYIDENRTRGELGDA